MATGYTFDRRLAYVVGPGLLIVVASLVGLALARTRFCRMSGPRQGIGVVLSWMLAASVWITLLVLASRH